MLELIIVFVCVDFAASVCSLTEPGGIDNPGTCAPEALCNSAAKPGFFVRTVGGGNQVVQGGTGGGHGGDGDGGSFRSNHPNGAFGSSTPLARLYVAFFLCCFIVLICLSLVEIS